MEFIPVLVVVALTLGICFLADKVFVKLFRNRAQHRSGMSVKASKRYATIGLVIGALGVVALVAAYKQGVLILISGIVMLLLGICFITYYLCFGIYYNEESFIYSSFGRKSRTYMFKDIVSQQVYASGASIIIELHLSDGCSIQLQSSMNGVVRFMNKAFDGWLSQNNLALDDCSFHDPEKNAWFPNAQEE